MSEDDLVACLSRSNDYEKIAEQNITKPVSSGKSISSELPVSKSSEFVKTNEKKKFTALRSRFLLTLRSIRINQHLNRKTPSLEFIQNRSPGSEHILQGEQSPQSIGYFFLAKKKNSLTKRFSLSYIGKKKKKVIGGNLATTATQTLPPPDYSDHNPSASSCFANISCTNKLTDQATAEQVEKIQITIFGRKTEFKIPFKSEKSFEIDSSKAKPVPSEDQPKLNITESETDTSPSERTYCDNIKSAVTFSISLPLESSVQRNVAFRKGLSAPRLERQASREEFVEDEKFQYVCQDRSQERGIRFPRSTRIEQFQMASNLSVERFTRVHDYVNKTVSFNNLNELVGDDNEVPVNTPDRNLERVSPAPLLRDIAHKNNTSFFESASSKELNESPTSDAGRRRIKYVGQPTFYTDEEKEILKGKREASRNLSEISEYSFESDFTSVSAMPAFSDLVMEISETSVMASETEKREHLYKILVIGELGAGKTSFIKRYVHQFFSANYRATIGVDFALKVLHWDHNTIVRLQLWDIAGQERFGNMTRVYYKEAVGAFIVFDVTRNGTFDAVTKWKEDLDSKVQLPGGGSIPCILLANKCDQDKQGLVTDAEKMDEYVRNNGFSGWFETSAKENINIEEAARALVSQILLNDKLITAADVVDHDKFALDIANRKQLQSSAKKSCSC